MWTMKLDHEREETLSPGYHQERNEATPRCFYFTVL